jgi:hypothetical protein
LPNPFQAYIELAFEYAVLVTVVVHSGTEGNSANITLLMSFSWEVSKRRKSKHESMSSTHGKKDLATGDPRLTAKDMGFDV